MIVYTPSGALEGRAENGVRIFRGIPYAQAPVGDLRFRAPQKLAPWEGVRQALTFSPICPQEEQEPGSFYHKEFYADPAFQPPMREDCLYLNIWAPEGEGPFPVAVWFHGGAYLHGFGSEQEFDGEAYARRGVILVTVNYRLGLFGFFAHPELTARDGHSGNYGILDQIAALEWVRDHIASFGGDPGNVTAFGQSAGGGSVHTLVRSPLTRGLIHRAIIQSAGGYKSLLSRKIPLARLEKAAVKFLKDKKLTLQALTELPAPELLALSKDFQKCGMLCTGSFLPLSPCVDGYVLHESMDDALEQQRLLSIPYLLGSTRDDIGVGRAARNDPSKNKLHRSAMEMCFRNNRGGRPSYCYFFRRQMPGDKAGAFHSSELWYIFGTLHRCWRPLTGADEALSQRMLRVWTDFMKTGDPGFPPCREDAPYVEIFDIA